MKHYFVLLASLLLLGCQGQEQTIDLREEAKEQLLSTDSIPAWQSIVKDYKSIHVMVALCDNANQGIVPVPAAIGNGQDPKNNLYWGALYGVKSQFGRARDWNCIGTLPSSHPYILERVLFVHRSKAIYLLADAYDGAHIKQCNIDFLHATAQQFSSTVVSDSLTLQFGDQSDLLAYVGHNGLMDFSLDLTLSTDNPVTKDVVILACASSYQYRPWLQMSNAEPLLWTTSLLAPEAYVLEAAIEAWIAERPEDMPESAAQAYNTYQKCGIRGARGLFTAGY